MKSTLFVGFALLASLIAVPHAAGAQATDAELAERIAEAVRRYPKFSVFDDVNVLVSNRVVTLTGRVTSPKKKEELGQRTANIDGVRSLVNQIGVLPASERDDQLRVVVARAIYNHPAFWRYADLANPPIHIVIENQRVTLTGEVDSATDRMLAFSLAQVAGALSVTNQIKVGPKQP